MEHTQFHNILYMNEPRFLCANTVSLVRLRISKLSEQHNTLRDLLKSIFDCSPGIRIFKKLMYNKSFEAIINKILLMRNILSQWS